MYHDLPVRVSQKNLCSQLSHVLHPFIGQCLWYDYSVLNVEVGLFPWPSHALSCFEGLFFILPTSVGNMHGQKAFLFFSLAVTAVFSYAPFSTLMWYYNGTPHNVTTVTVYKEVCPAWLDFDPELAAFLKNESADTTQYFVKLDYRCMNAIQWCEAHPEVQGKVSAKRKSLGVCQLRQ
jgi:hypothetical protein